MFKTQPCIFTLLAAGVLTLAWTSRAHASYHLMQIKQVIGGVNGDTTAQAIQLSMRSSIGQNFVLGKQLKVYNAAGANPITIITFPSNVPNGGSGRPILITSANFNSHTSPTCVPDFTMTNLIPASYLAAGSLTFEDPVPPPLGFGGIMWRLSWGGASYTGSGLGLNINDADGQFNPAWGIACPSTTLRSVFFPGSALALSTNNLADYVQSTGASVWTNNALQAFTVVQPTIVGDLNGDGIVNSLDLGILLSSWTLPPALTCSGTACQADLNGDTVVNSQDLGILLSHWTI